MTSAPTDSTIVTTVKHDWTWIIQHGIGVLLVALICFGSIYGVESLISRHDAENASKYEKILSEQAAQTKTLQQQLADDVAANAQRDASYQRTIAQLSQGIIQRNADAQKQQKADASLDASSAAQRLSQQTQSTGEIAVAENNVVLDLPIARRVVSDLDSLVVVQGNLADTQAQLKAQQGLTADAQTEASDAQQVIAAQASQLTEQDKVCKEKLTAANAAARKGKLKWFGIGFLTGFVAGHAW
jgi:hypothetical protein